MIIRGDKISIEEACRLLGGKMVRDACIVDNMLSIGSPIPAAGDYVVLDRTCIEIGRSPINIVFNGSEKPIIVVPVDEKVERVCGRGEKFRIVLKDCGKYILVTVPRSVIWAIP